MLMQMIFILNMCTADTIYTYFQDKIGLTHYFSFFVGNNASGKSNNLTVFHFSSISELYFYRQDLSESPSVGILWK